MKFLFGLLILGVCFGSTILFGSNVQAMQVEPAILDLGAEPGETITSTFSVVNEEGRPQTYYFSIQKFLPQGETGDMQFLPLSETEGLPQWTFLSRSSALLAPGERARIPFTIRLPKEAVRGSTQEAIFVSTAAPQTAGVGVGLRTGLLVFVKIGAVQESQLTMARIEVPTSSWFTHLPVPVTFTLENKGAAYEIPRGTIVVRNFFGKERARIPFNTVGSRLLPQARRQFTVIWQEHAPSPATGFWSEVGEELSNGGFGPYTLTLETEAETMFPVTLLFRVSLWPLRLFVVIGTALAGIVAVVWLVRRNLLHRLLRTRV